MPISNEVPLFNIPPPPPNLYNSSHGDLIKNAGGLGKLINSVARLGEQRDQLSLRSPTGENDAETERENERDPGYRHNYPLSTTEIKES
jgi:hypothetical protein